MQFCCLSQSFSGTNARALWCIPVELASNKRILHPYLTYCYLGIKTSLQRMLLRPSFVAECNEWRSRKIDNNVLQDIYDGRVWNDFQTYNGVPFLSLALSFAFTTNLDWFQPFKHSKYSMGAIYLTIMNLPRNVRNRIENVILVGLLPGPHEPTNLNGYLTPLVNELLDFWKGMKLNVHGSSDAKLVRFALLCASCDLPAGRKLCGFVTATYNNSQHAYAHSPI